MTRSRPTAKPEKLQRFRDLPREHTDAPLSTLFRAVGAPEPLERAELADVRTRLARRNPIRSRRHAREILVIAGALLSGVGVAFGALGVVEWARAPAQPSIAATPGAPGARPARAPHSQSRRLAVPSSEPSPAPSAAVERESTSADAPRSAPRAPDTRSLDGRAPSNESAEATPERSALALESASLARALVALRRDHDAVAALALLDAHAAEFPHGALSLEARVARVDALVALGRKADALAVLAQLPLDRPRGTVGRAAELRLLRAELTAERDCTRATADLDALVAAAPAGVRERALYARASCRLRTGDRADAESDLRRYLADYPEGRYAREVEERLR